MNKKTLYTSQETSKTHWGILNIDDTISLNQLSQIFGKKNVKQTDLMNLKKSDKIYFALLKATSTATSPTNFCNKKKYEQQKWNISDKF